MNYLFRKALLDEIEPIWEILQDAIIRRKNEGSNQWQDGYPNRDVLLNDIQLEQGFVLVEEGTVLGYMAVILNDEPAYTDIVGKWLTEGDFVVIHRVAIAKNHLGKGLSKIMIQFVEELALEKNIFSVKADTNFDNVPMTKIFLSLGYTLCGEVFFRGSPRRAYEKVVSKK